MVYASDLGCNPAHGLSDDDGNGLITALLVGAGAVGLAYAGMSAYENAKAVKRAIDRELEMMRKYKDLAQWWENVYYDTYAPIEDQEAEEAYALEDVQPEYDMARGRARTAAWIPFKGVTERATHCLSRYCTGLRADIVVDLAAAQGVAVAAADGLGYRNERAYVEARNEEIYKRKYNVVLRGRNLVADNVSLAKATQGIYGDIAQQAWAGLSGAAQYLGYFLNRREATYPTTFTRNRTLYQSEATGKAVATPEEVTVVGNAIDALFGSRR